MKAKSAMGVCFRAIAVNYRSSNYIRVIWVNTVDGNCFAEEVDIPVTVAGVYSGLDFNDVTVVGIIDSGLNVVEIRRVIVIDGDYSRLGCNA